jgi:hypothetical protein
VIEYGSDPATWLVKHGCPAACLGDPREPLGGLPSYEHEDGGLVVYDILGAQASSNGNMMLFSRWYGTASVLAPDDLVPLHHEPTAIWEWRPLVYRRSMYGCWMGLGSQSELGWRYGMNQVMAAAYADGEFTMDRSDERAATLLHEQLSAYQLTELALSGRFRVVGGATGHTYEVELGDGFDRVDPTTGETLVDYCFHPEGWIPNADVALATKLALEDEELEADTLANARATIRRPTQHATPEQRRAREIELELIG